MLSSSFVCVFLCSYVLLLLVVALAAYLKQTVWRIAKEKVTYLHKIQRKVFGSASDSLN